MNGDLGTLILIGIIIVAVVLLIQRLMAQQQNPYTRPGNNRPQYDDPNISSHGGFGGNNPQQGQGHRQYDDPDIESHGGFGSGGSSGYREAERRSNYENASSQRAPERTPERTRRNDDPNVSSHGGFGGQR